MDLIPLHDAADDDEDLYVLIGWRYRDTIPSPDLYSWQFTQDVGIARLVQAQRTKEIREVYEKADPLKDGHAVLCRVAGGDWTPVLRQTAQRWRDHAEAQVEILEQNEGGDPAVVQEGVDPENRRLFDLMRKREAKEAKEARDGDEFGRWILRSVDTPNGYKTEVIGDPIGDGEVEVIEMAVLNSGETICNQENEQWGPGRCILPEGHVGLHLVMMK